MESSQNRDGSHIPCTGRQILKPRTTREVPSFDYFKHLDPLDAIGEMWKLTLYLTVGETETQGKGRQFLKSYCQRLRGESGPEAGAG